MINHRNMNEKFGAPATMISQQIIDLERGIVTHSKTSSQEGFNRYFSQGKPKTYRPEMTHYQFNQWLDSYWMAEKYLTVARMNATFELKRLLQSSTRAYAAKHQGPFYETLQALQYPIVQDVSNNYNRNDIDRQNLVRMTNFYVERGLRMGLNCHTSGKQVVDSVANYLRNIVNTNSQLA